MITLVANKKKQKEELADYYWAYSDILRTIGINPSTYDQRILAFMCVKLLIDNDKLLFNFDYENNFGLSDKYFKIVEGIDTKNTFLNIIENIKLFGTDNLKYFHQDAKYNPDKEKNVLTYLNHFKTFELAKYVQELSNEYFEMVLDIYVTKANFKSYPKEQYKDLYESTVSRMKKLSGDLTGQHFTQKSIIHLICEMSIEDIKDNEKIAIYDPTCGTGSMLMESAYYFAKKLRNTNIQVYGQENHGQTWLLAKIFLEITSLDSKSQGIYNTIAYGNTLTEPAFANGINGKESFDFIIANPPFGVDWKHDYENIIENMNSKRSTFFNVTDEKGKIVTPKKSDGQFLFMQHIINLMKKEDDRGKRAKAGIISSSTLISTGSKSGSESKIRNAIFEEKLVSAVLEQPNAMFTNTDISSHIWFLDTWATDKIKVLKADTKETELFSNHPQAKDKMKNSYSVKNIKDIKRLLLNKTDEKYVSKTLNTKNRYEINISNEVGFKDDMEDLNFDELQEELETIMKSMCEDFKSGGLFGIK